MDIESWWITGPLERMIETLMGLFEEARKSNPLDDVLTSAANDIRSRASLNILIWGPGPDAGAVYAKRCDIRDRLIKLGHAAHFSEEACKPEILVAGGLNLTVLELLQAHAYDYIICLMASPGSIAEVHDFAKDRKIAHKMMICIDERHRSGYSAIGTLRIFEGFNGKLDWFSTPSDIEGCLLATRVLSQVQKVAEGKQYLIANGGVS